MSASKTAQYLSVVNQMIGSARDAGVVHLHTEDEQFNGRTIRIQGKDLVNFGSCSYLGLELNEKVKTAAIDAILKYGTQYSSSRAYVSLGMYEELGDLMEQIFGAPVMISASTTLGHLSTIPTLIGENDAVILDQQVHASVHMAVQVVKARGVRVETVRHNRMDLLENMILSLKNTCERIWYMADGVYSMYGDYAPATELTQLLNRYNQLHLYVDDAHGVSWTGQHGCGFAREAFGRHERLYIAGSFAKSFGGGGGFTVFPNKESRDFVRTCGGTMIFSGPIQPPTLAAIIESARIHLSDEIKGLQAALKRKITLFNQVATEYELSQPMISDAPIFFCKIGNPETTIALIQRLMERGYYANLAVFPSVPYHASGLRMTLHNHLSDEDVRGLVSAIAEEADAMKTVADLLQKDSVANIQLAAAS
jgi:7-keto-8-aminopelargonate synthetase-like enzyme